MANTPKEQTPAQFIADLLCKRKGKKENIPTPPGYWSMPEWKVEYKKQILSANKFLKIYPLEVIAAVLNDKKHNWVYSLYFPSLKQALEVEMEKYSRAQVREEHLREKEKTKVEIIQTENAPTILDNSSKQSLHSLLD
jgi:hypothetical protein